MQPRHKMKLDPSERMLGNASLAHILANGCYGRLKMKSYQSDNEAGRYAAKYECVKCGKIIESQHNKPGWRLGNG